MVARSESMFGCYDSYSYRLWSLANVWSTCQFPSIANGLTKVEEINSNPEYFIKCPKCQKGYPGFQALKEHIESTHTDISSAENTTGIISNSVSPTPSVVGPGGPYGCSQCATSFASKDQLQKHELLHSPNAQVSCKICNKTFANVYRLQRHMISHDESAILRKFKCTLCEKAFKFKHHLKEHIRIHSGEKPFECVNCGKRFSHSGSYSSHSTSKKCLVVNLKLGRTRGSPGNALHDKSPSQTSRMNKRIPGNPLNNNLTTSPNHNAYLPILPKYTEAAAAFLHTSLASNHAIHPFYMPPTSLLSNSGPTISPYSIPSLNHILEQLQGASPHRPQFIEAPEDMNVSNSAESIKQETATSPKINEGETAGSKSTSSSCGDLVVATDAESATEQETSMKEESNAEINSNGSDLEAVKRILETVNASVTKQLLQANMQKYNNDTDTDDRISPSLNFQNEFTCTSCKHHFPSKEAYADHECDQTDIQSEGLAAKLEDAVTVKVEDTHSSNYSCDEYDIDSDRMLDKNDEYDMDCESVTTTDQVSEDGRKVRVRSLIADKQLKVLKDHYNMNPRPKREELVKIAEKIGFPVRVVQVWFQNTRARDRREGRLIHVPYNPLGSVPLRLPAAIVPSSLQSSGLRVGYPLASSPQYNLEQPLDLSTKKNPLLSTHSSPSDSPQRPPSSNPHSDSGEEVVNLSYKSSRSPTPFHQSYQNHYQNSNSSSDLRRSPSPIHFNNGSKLAKILAQPTHSLSLPNVGLVPMDGFMRLPALTQLINNRISNLSPSSEKRCWSEDNESIVPQDAMHDELMNKRAKVSQMVLKGLNSPSLVNTEREIEGQFICDECDKSFSKQSSLARHKYEHSGQRPHKCDECTKAFKHKHHLTEHKRLHSGEKPFQCVKCLKRFSHSGSYSQHMNHRFSYCKPYRE